MVLSISDEALAVIIGLRDEELTDEEYALRIEVTGVSGNNYTYDLSFERVSDAGPDDVIERHGELAVLISRASTEKLEGSALAVSEEQGGLVLDNPNTPSPTITAEGAGELTGPIADRVRQILDGQINPAIASHGGRADLVAVEDDAVFLRLSGGCQGCGLAAVTLSQGIEQAILNAIPEVTRVIDVTDHAAGTNPYYEPAKK